MKIAQIDTKFVPPSIKSKPAPQPNPEPEPLGITPCRTVDQPDGGIQVHFLLSPLEAHRLKLRVSDSHRSTEELLWERVIRPAIQGYLF